MGNFFSLYFLRKDKNPLNHSRSSKYDADQDGRTGTHESSDVIELEAPKLSAGKRGTDSVHDRGEGGGSNSDHLPTLGEERRDKQKYREVENETKLKVLFQYLKVTHSHLILQDKITGAWLSVRGTTVSGTVLSATEFRNYLCAYYNVSPLNH